jgi:hypothetical protein
MAREGSIPALRLGQKHWRFRASDLAAWAEDRVRSAAPAPSSDRRR